MPELDTLSASDSDLILTLCVATKTNTRGEWRRIAAAAKSGRKALDQVANKLLSPLAPTGNSLNTLFERHLTSVVAVRSQLEEHALRFWTIGEPGFPVALSRPVYGIPFVIRPQTVAAMHREPLQSKLVGVICPPDASLALLGDLKQLIPRIVRSSVFIGASSRYGLNTIIHGPSLRRTNGTAFVVETGVLQMLRRMQLTPYSAGAMLHQIITGGYLISSYWPTDAVGEPAKGSSRPHLLPLLARVGIVAPGSVDSTYAKTEVLQFIAAGTPVLLPYYFLTQPLWHKLVDSSHVIPYETIEDIPQLCGDVLRLGRTA